LSEGQPLNVPGLRFPEFSGAWEAKSLGDFFTFKNGVNADKSMYGRGRKFINVLDVIADAPIYYDNIIGEVDISEDDFSKNEVKFGDVLFQRSSETREEVGQSNIYLDTVSATFGGFVIRGRPTQEIESRYFDALLKTAAVRKDMTSRSGGSTRYNIGQESLEAVAIVVAPTLPEQQKIAAFLSAVDARAALLRRRREALLVYKKGVMQRLFSRQLRFAKADDSAFPDWQEKRLGVVCDIRKGEQLNRDDMPEGGTYPVVNGGTSPSGYAAQANAKAETITISEGGNSCGFVAWQSADFWLGGHCYAINPKEGGLTKKYLFHLLKYNERGIMRLRVGSGLPNIQKSDLSKLLLEIPHPEEQQKIADFLTALDAKIDAVTAQLSATQAFKKGLLQQMFV